MQMTDDRGQNTMNQRQFVRERQEAWRRFEHLVNRLQRRSFRKLPAGEIREFSRLFREVSGDLAVLRSREWDRRLVEYLNGLVARGHNVFYRAPPGNMAACVRFLTAGFPRLLRANCGYFLVAAVLFFLPGGISWGIIQNDPSLASRVIPDRYLEQFDAMYSDGGAPSAENDASGNDESGDEEEPVWNGGFGEERAFMAGFYVRNNVGIALACFARGILLGVGTVYTLLFNSIFIGSIGGYVVSQGGAERFLSFVISHGAFELTAIAVAGGAGLMLGDAILHPGQRTRKEALLVRGVEAVKIATGAAVMLLIAALIEAFWSPSGVPVTFKYVVGTALWVLVFLYLALAGRGEGTGVRGQESGVGFSRQQ